jgi:molybdopterin/thiamine biosynthesis adenylyltransferase
VPGLRDAGLRSDDVPDLIELVLLGCGAIGSRVEEMCAVDGVGLTCVDREAVAADNIGVAAYGPGDVGRAKATVLAARRSTRGGLGRALHGDLRYVVRPGLLGAARGVICCLDNPCALHDAATAIWAGATAGLPVLVLTCGGAGRPGWLARLFITPGRCVACTFGRAERDAARRAVGGTSCEQTSAPRASASSARAAAAAGVRVLTRWLAGDRSLANCRLQDDGAGEYVARMPGDRSRHCTAHEDDSPIVALDGSIATVTVGTLGERALACAGDDAVIALGRRAVPLGGVYCPACRAVWGSPPLLLPAALGRPRPCACAVAPRPLGERRLLGARELLALDDGALGLAAWGAAPGDEFVALGRAGRVRLRCAFDWSELEDGHA